jgi:tetratricopeptide (TPR) repeat protein
VPDEPNQSTPDCDALLGPDAPRGRNAGAALEQIGTARRELVRGKLDDALRTYCRGHLWDVDNVTLLVELGRATLMSGDAERAAGYAQRAAKLSPHNTQIKWLVGDAAARRGQVEKARAAFVAARGADADQRGVYEGLSRGELSDAESVLKRQDYRTAERLFRRAAILDLKSAAASAGLARSLLGLKQVAAALAWAKRAEQLNPRDPDVQVALGDALAESGQPEQAQAAWKAATLLDPDHRPARKRLAAAANP